MKAVWKYEIAGIMEGSQLFVQDIPKGSKFLSLGMQHGTPQMWWLVDTEAPTEPHHFEIVGTGNPMINEDWVFVGSWPMHGATYIFHLFASPAMSELIAPTGHLHSIHST